MSTPSKKHHYVPQAQLRHFSIDGAGKRIWVFDKETDRAFASAIQDTGSENNFNTVELDTGRWNFEHIFQDVDARSGTLIAQILDRWAVGWLEPDDRAALVDLFATQMLRTHFARTSPRHLAGQLRALVANLGYDPDADPDMSMPSEKALRLGAVRSFLARERIAGSMVRLVPALFAAPEGRHFVISDDPVALTNPFAYGDIGLESHGIIVLLPIAPDLAIALVCPTIISRYEAIDHIEIDSERRGRLAGYRDGFRRGDPIEIEAAELEGWNERQVARSARRLYAATDDFDFARKKLSEFPGLRSVDTHVQLGEMGKPPPPRTGMPAGLHLVITGKADHCILPIAEIDRSGEGLTARTISTDLLKLIAADTGELRADLYDSGRQRRSIAQATVERFGDPTGGWFRVVHKDEGLRSFMRSIDEVRAPRS